MKIRNKPYLHRIRFQFILLRGRYLVLFCYFPLFFYDLILLLIILIEIIIEKRILRIPQLVEFLYDLHRNFTLLCGNNFGIPLLIFRQSSTCDIGAADDNTINLFLLKNIAFGVEALVCPIHIIHLQSNIGQFLQLF